MAGRVIQQQQHLLPGQVIPPPRRPRLPGRAGSAAPRPRRSAAGWPARRPGPPAAAPACARAAAGRTARPGNAPASRCAACTAKAVLPTPAIPPIAWIPTTPPPAAAAPVTAPASCASSAARPVKLAISRGSVRVAAAAAPSPAASTSSAGSRPRAAASNSARCGPVRPSAPASSRAVSWRAVRFTPRSRSLTDRGDRLAASASSSWVSPASSRSRRSSPPKLSAGCSATGPSPLTTPRPPLTRHGRPRNGQDPAASLLLWVSCGRPVW